MKPPPRWTFDQLKAEADRSAEIFCAERLAPSVEWQEQLAACKVKFDRVFNELGNLGPNGFTKAAVAEAFRLKLGEALRYLAAPPVSADDLKVIADVVSLAPGKLTADSDRLAKVFKVLKAVVDPYRFPWIAEQRNPTELERSAALLASSVLLASQRVTTERRTSGKKQQEKLVADYLTGLRFENIKANHFRTMMEGPQSGQFCGECKLVDRKADLFLRLPDTRLMPIECKVSNSSTNSVKRVVNDAAAKANQWIRDCGITQVVPVAVIGGVFNPLTLVQAQNAGLTIIWAHDLATLGEFIESTRKS